MKHLIIWLLMFSYGKVWTPYPDKNIQYQNESTCQSVADVLNIKSSKNKHFPKYKCAFVGLAT